MFPTDDLRLDCDTCVAANTTACEDCVVHHVLANAAGPIAFVPRSRGPIEDPIERAVQLFVNAGLVDEQPAFVPEAEFEALNAPPIPI